MTIIAPDVPRLAYTKQLDPVADSLGAMLVMTSSTLVVELLAGTALTLADVSNLAELDGPGYARKPLQGVTFNQDLPGGVSWFDAEDLDYTGVQGGSEQVVACVVYQDGADDSARRILEVFNDNGFPWTPVGAERRVEFSAGGILRMRTR